MSRFSFPSHSGDFLGAHMSTKGGLTSMFARGRAIEASAMALFSKNSNQWKGKVLTEEDAATFARLRSEHGFATTPLMTHASYLINLATTNPEFHAKSLVAMVDELDRAERLGCFGVVLHPGAHMGAGADHGLDQIARSLDEIHAATPGMKVVTLLETAAGQGSCVGCTFEELATVLRLVDDPSRVAVCVDTCHIFAAGYDLRTRDEYERTIDSLLEHVGLENVAAFHLNDSKKGLGSRVDRHEHIGEGMLGLAPFEFLLNDERFARVPKVLETPKSEPPEEENQLDIRNLTRLRSLVAALAS
jgi:deoxyribonuclease-4